MTLSAFLASTLDLFFPRRCLSCSVFLRHPLSRTRESGFSAWLCPACRGQLVSCEPLVAGWQPGAPDRVYSGYLYTGVLERIIPAWKYHRRYDLLPLVAALCREAGARVEAFGIDADLVIEMPLSRRALKKRGFNQSLFIAEQLAAGLGCRLVVGGLEKVVETPRQAALDRQSRLRNLGPGVFRAADPEDFRERRVLLCDDVMTTGTTLRAAAAVLRQSGAAAVYGFTLARVP